MILAEARPAYDYPIEPTKRQAPRVAQSTRRAVRKHLTVSPKTRYIIFWLMGVVLALGLASRFAVASRMTIDIGGLNRQLAVIRAENQQLQLQASELKSLARIEQVASTRLGMVRPTEARALLPTGASAATTVAAADVSDNPDQHGGWIASVQRWLTRLIHTGRAEAKGL